MRTARKFILFIGVALSLTTVTTAAVIPGQPTPCGTATGSNPTFATQGLTPVNGGLVYDSNQGLCWLADANPAGNPAVRARLSLSPLNADGSTPLINPDGTMDWETAVNFVNALNSFNGGKGWLNHNNWQLPTTIQSDKTCSSENAGNFGVLCTASALGNLYNVGLARTYPDSVVSDFKDIVWPFRNLLPGLYWASDQDRKDGGQLTFSFNTGLSGSNTTNYNFFHVLPMTHDVLGSVPSDPRAVVPYHSGPGAGIAVYDRNTGLSWPLNANLPAENNFGFTAATVLNSNVNTTQFPMAVPMIDRDGTVFASALCAQATANDPCPAPHTGWIVSMNNNAYAGSSNWQLPALDDLKQLYQDLNLQPGDVSLEWLTFVGPFWRLQPGFYWACTRDPFTSTHAGCDFSLMPGPPDKAPMAYSFNFDDGFLGTDLLPKQFYVMVYFSAPDPQ
jgi:hypothetical protein